MHGSIFCALQAYFILDELFIGGELQESSKKEVLRVCAQMDDLMDEEQQQDGQPGGGRGSMRR
jgi:AP-1 complex subunit sigma 1/2